MKNHPIPPPRPLRQIRLRPARTPTGRDRPRPSPRGDDGRTPDPIQQHATERRLYTDFLALALYPGMNPRRTDTAA